jgi:hypothetical protein
MSDSLSIEPALDLGHLRQAIQEEYTVGINFRARKAADEQGWQEAKASLSCEVPTPLEGPASSDAGDKGPPSP